MTDRGPHPNIDRLAAFRVGRVGSAELDEIDRHLFACDDCCQALERMPDVESDDSIPYYTPVPETGVAP